MRHDENLALTFGVLIPILRCMANQPNPNKILIGVRTPRELEAVLRSEASERGMALPSYIVQILQQYVGNAREKLTPAELEELEEETRAAQQETGSRRSARRRRSEVFVRGRIGVGEIMTGSAVDWRACLESLARGWRLREEGGGFYLQHERLPGNVGVVFTDGCYAMQANYWGEVQAAEFSKPLKWRFGGRRSRGWWGAPLHLPALALELAPMAQEDLVPRLRNSEDAALTRIMERLRELIGYLRSHHRRAIWWRAAAQVAEAAGWSPFIWQWDVLACERDERHLRFGKVFFDVYESVKGVSIRIEMGVRSGHSGNLRDLLLALGKPELAARVYGGRVSLAELDFEDAPDGSADEDATAQLIARTLKEWMQLLNSLLSQNSHLEDFAALALETANEDRASICRLAAVIVRGGRIVQREELLIQPPGNEYDEEFTGWHGISAADTAEAPSFAEGWASLATALEGLPLIMHTDFHSSCLETAHARADLNWDDHIIHLTISLAHQLLPGLPSYSLPRLAEHLGLPRPQCTMAKAEATAEIANKLFHMNG